MMEADRASSPDMDFLDDPPASQEPANTETKPRKLRQTDGGPELLPDMGEFVLLARKIRSRSLMHQWLEFLQLEGLDAVEWEHKTAACYKRSLFTTIVPAAGAVRSHLEEAAQRILLLSDDYGCEAVKSLLDDADPEEREAIERAGDKHGRALYLYLCRLTDANDRRFEQAETARQQNKQWKSELYSSHFRGPKDVQIALDDAAREKLKTAIAEIYPKAPLHDVVIEHFQRRDLRCADADDEGSPVWLHTIVVGFNGKETHWDKIVDGEVTSRHDQALQRITFSYEPSSGSLSVFSDDRQSRRELAKAVRDVVLASEAEIGEMPLYDFDLSPFATPAVSQLLKLESGDGVESVGINLIKVAKPLQLRGGSGRREIASHMTIQRDRADQRDVYQVALEDYQQSDFSSFDLVQVKLGLRLAKQKDRRARNLAVQISTPNGLNDGSKTEEERQLVMRLLRRWGIATEF